MHKKAAFTMVELIFVIVILGILAAVAVPRLAASREDAQIAAVAANLSTLIRDIKTHHAATGSVYPLYCEIITTPAPRKTLEQTCRAYGNFASFDATGDNCCVYASFLSPAAISNAVAEDIGTYPVLYFDNCFIVGLGGIGKDITDREFNHDKFHASTKQSGDARCQKLFANPAIKALLTDANGNSIGAKDSNGTACVDKKDCELEFSLAGSGVAFE